MIWKYLHQEEISDRIKLFNLTRQVMTRACDWKLESNNVKWKKEDRSGSLQVFEQVTEESVGCDIAQCDQMSFESCGVIHLLWCKYRLKFSGSGQTEGQMGDHNGPFKFHCLFEGENSM